MADEGQTRIVATQTVGPGTRLNGIFEIDEKIAAGGMGEVFRGRNIATSEPVAIKIVLAEFVKDEMIRELFFKEAKVLNSLNHPAIVRYQMFTVEPVIGRPYLVMEYINGCALEQRLRKAKFTVAETRVLIAKVADGLETAHQAGVVHRDLSPDNILLVNDNVAHPKIIDFGIARTLASGQATILGNQFAGRANFASPEQYGLYGGNVTASADVYSLALVIINMLRGEPLDMGGTQYDQIEKRRTVPDLSDIEPELRPVLAMMLTPDPAKRLLSMSDIAGYFSGRTPLPELAQEIAVTPEVPAEPVSVAAETPPLVTAREEADEGLEDIWALPSATPQREAPAGNDIAAESFIEVTESIPDAPADDGDQSESSVKEPVAVPEATVIAQIAPVERRVEPAAEDNGTRIAAIVPPRDDLGQQASSPDLTKALAGRQAPPAQQSTPGGRVALPQPLPDTKEPLALPAEQLAKAFPASHEPLQTHGPIGDIPISQIPAPVVVPRKRGRGLLFFGAGVGLLAAALGAGIYLRLPGFDRLPFLTAPADVEVAEVKPEVLLPAVEEKTKPATDLSVVKTDALPKPVETITAKKPATIDNAETKSQTRDNTTIDQDAKLAATEGKEELSTTVPRTLDAASETDADSGKLNQEASTPNVDGVVKKPASEETATDAKPTENVVVDPVVQPKETQPVNDQAEPAENAEKADTERFRESWDTTAKSENDSGIPATSDDFDQLSTQDPAVVNPTETATANTQIVDPRLSEKSEPDTAVTEPIIAKAEENPVDLPAVNPEADVKVNDIPVAKDDAVADRPVTTTKAAPVDLPAVKPEADVKIDDIPVIKDDAVKNDDLTTSPSVKTDAEQPVKKETGLLSGWLGGGKEDEVEKPVLKAPPVDIGALLPAIEADPMNVAPVDPVTTPKADEVKEADQTPTKPAEDTQIDSEAATRIDKVDEGDIEIPAVTKAKPAEPDQNNDTRPADTVIASLDPEKQKPEVSALPGDQSSAAEWLQAFDGGACFFAETRQIEGQTVRISSISNDIQSFHALNNSFKQKFGYEARIQGRTIDDSQCLVTTLLNTLHKSKMEQLSLNLDADKIKNGDFLSGELSHITKPQLKLLLIDHNGMVYDISARLKKDGSSFLFRQSIKDKKPREQIFKILLALGSDEPIAFKGGKKPMKVDKLVPELIEAANRGGLQYGYDFFKITAAN